MLPDEVRLLFLGFAIAFAGTLLRLAGPAAATLAFGLSGQLLPQPAQGIEDMLVDVLDHMKDAELVPCLGPDLGQHGRIEVGAVGDHDLGHQAPVVEVVQEAAHVVLVVVPHQSEGDREIVDGVGGQQQSAMAQMDFVDAQGAGEVVQSPLPIGRHFDLAHFPVQTVVEKAIGELEMEIALESLTQPFHAHAVVEQTVDDSLADPVGILRTRLDPIELGAKGLATRAVGAVFSNFDFENHDLAIGDIANQTGMSVLAPSHLAALRTGEGLRRARKPSHANTRFQSIHACVPPGFCA